MRVMVRLAAVGVVLVGAIGRAGPPPTPLLRNCVVTEQTAYLVGEAALFAPPPVVRIEWSPDGRYAFAERMAKPDRPGAASEASLWLWDARAREVSRVLTRKARDWSIGQVEWASASGALYVSLSPATPPDSGAADTRCAELVRISCASGAARTVGLGPLTPDSSISVSVSEDGARVAAEVTSLVNGVSTTRLFLLTAAGSAGPALAVPPGGIVSGWHDARSMVVTVVTRSGAGGGPRKRTTYLLDMLSGKVSELPPAAGRAVPRVVPEKALSLLDEPARARSGGATASAPVIWLCSNVGGQVPRAVVAFGAVDGHLSPTMQAVAYVAQGAAFVRPIEQISREMYEKLAREAAVTNTKQVGLALMMYCQDYDENYPNGELLGEKVYPYLKNNDVFEGFVYTHGGGPLSDITEPSNTELGYMLGPGGRAVLFADGHVKWRADTPPGGAGR